MPTCNIFFKDFLSSAADVSPSDKTYEHLSVFRIK